MNCCPETLCSGRQFIEAWAKYAGFDDTTVGQIVLACDEACSNVFRHGYGTQPGPVTLHARIEEQALLIDIRDQAPPLQTEEIKGRDLDDLRPGGLGTVILRKTFDSVEYQPGPAGNRVRLRRMLPDFST
jgi:anti-sigma regulatory factor (Ser/Thr protein kinase)